MNAHTNTFDSEPVVGQLVTGHSDGPGYHSTWSGIYEGVRPSEGDGQPYHYFRDGEINGTPQATFGHPLDRDTFDMDAAAAAIYATIVGDVEAEDTLYVTDRPDPDYDFMLRSFTELHDFVDANEYLINVLGEGYDEADSATWNALADAVDALLRATPVVLMEARDGEINGTPQGLFGHPVSQTTTDIAASNLAYMLANPAIYGPRNG